MRTIDEWISEYGESHKNSTNKMIHWICVPLIMLSLLALIEIIPFPLYTIELFTIKGQSIYLNWIDLLLTHK